MNKKKAFILTTALSLSVIPVVANADSFQSILEQNQMAQQETSQEITRIKEQKTSVLEEIQIVQKKIQELDGSLEKIQKDINKTEKEINELSVMVKELQIEEEKIHTFLNEREDDFKKRVSAYYRNERNLSYLGFLFDSNSFSEFIEHFVSYRKIIQSDKDFMKKYIEKQERVRSIKESAEQLTQDNAKKTVELEKLKVDFLQTKAEKENNSILLESKKQELEKEEQEKTAVLQSLQENRGQIQEIIKMVNDPSYTGGSNTVQQVIAPFIIDATRIHREKGIPASIILGQIILESSGKYHGLSGLAYEGKNLFGVKGSGTAGSITMNTTEYINGEKVVIPAQFAKYETYYDSMEAHANLLLKPLYQKYLRNAQTIEEYARGIKAAGYATDPNYAESLIGVINSNGLKSFDVF